MKVRTFAYHRASFPSNNLKVNSSNSRGIRIHISCVKLLQIDR